MYRTNNDGVNQTSAAEIIVKYK